MTQDRSDLFRCIQKSLAAVKTIPPGKISESAFLKKDLGLDSIDIVDLLFELEKATNSTVDLAALQARIGLKSHENRSDFSISQIIDYLETRGRAP